MLADLALRKLVPGIGTPHVEADAQKISGVADGIATGAPVVITFANANTKSSDYKQLAQNSPARIRRLSSSLQLLRCCPRHPPCGGMFSGRMTTPLVATGAADAGYDCHTLGIYVGSYISRIGWVENSVEYTAADLVRSRKTIRLGQ